MRDIKIKFLTKAPAGFDSNVVELCSKFELNEWQASNQYEIEVLEEPKKPKKSKKSKKKK